MQLKRRLTSMAKYKYNKKRNFHTNDIYVLHWGRRAGKTSHLARMCYEHPNSTMVIHNHRMREIIAREYPGVRVITMGHLEHAPVRHIRRIYGDLHIDEADLMNEETLGLLVSEKLVKAVSFSEGNETLYRIAGSSSNYTHRPSPFAIDWETRSYSPELFPPILRTA